MSTPKPKVHLICNAHLDPVWQWRWTEGCSEAIATFKNAVEILNEHPDLIFNHNEAILYHWVLKYDRKLFRQIQALADKGRWVISGGWFLQPDLNIPPTRNIVRHIIEGKKFFREHFNAEPKVAYNFDSFGHSSGLPQLIRRYGYEFYIHQRPEKEVLALPDSLYIWEGSDGTRIPAYRIECGLYHTERGNIQQRLEEGVGLVQASGRDVAVFWGLGNHGGGATREDLVKIDDFIQREKRIEIKHSSTELFFGSLKATLSDAPVFKGELQRVFAGTYTSMARLKRKALEASAAVEQTEKFAGLANGNEGIQLDETVGNDRVSTIWRDILFNDFHDIITGTCTRVAEEDALDLFGRAMENIRDLNMDLITRFNTLSKPFKAHIPVSVYNSVDGLIKFPIEFECMSDYRPYWDEEKKLLLSDRKGNIIPSQEEQADALLPFRRWRRRIVFMAVNMNSGINHFGLNPVDRRESDQSALLSLTRDYGIKYRVVKDTADSWGTKTWAWDEAVGEFLEVANSKRVISQGIIRTVQESEHILGLSSIVTRKISYTGWPVTEYLIRINWHAEHQRLKIVIPVDPAFNNCFCEIPGGTINRKPDGQEHCHGTWIQLSEDNKPGGISVVHNGLHGYDFVPGELSFSVLRSAAYCHWHEYKLPGAMDNSEKPNTGPAAEFMDQGIHHIRMAIWQSNEDSPSPEALSGWLNAPPLVYPHLPIGED